jgi:hypothetical protein
VKILVEIRLVKHLDEINQLRELFQICFKWTISEKYWLWKYVSNPLADSNPDVIVALDNGIIRGARPFFLTQMWLNDSKIVAAQHCDTMVHPDFRKEGIFNKMGTYSMNYLKEHNYALSYGFPGPMSRPGFLRQGYKIVAPTEIMFKPFNSARLLSKRINNQLLNKSMSFFFDTFLNSKIRRIIPQKGYSIEIFENIPQGLDEIDTWKPHNTIDLVRNKIILKWRFDDHPEHRYKYILVRKNQMLWGYAVISVQKQTDGMNYGIIMDYLIRDEDVHCLHLIIQNSIEELFKKNSDIIIVWSLKERAFQRELQCKLGFKSSLQFPYKKVIGYGYMDVLQINDQLAKTSDIYDKDNWRITNASADYT